MKEKGRRIRSVEFNEIFTQMSYPGVLLLCPPHYRTKDHLSSIIPVSDFRDLRPFKKVGHFEINPLKFYYPS